MAARKIDLAERPPDTSALAHGPREKCYPTVNVPDDAGALDPSMIGKTLTMQVEARVRGMRRGQREGGPVRTVYDLELRSMSPVRQGRQGLPVGRQGDYDAQRRRMTRG